ncbi:MAG TPA: ABC transporter substrate-binding protein [Limnochordales bacterium]
MTTSKYTRRRFLKQAGAMAAAGSILSVGFPMVNVLAQRREVRIGHIHPLTGGLALEGNEMRDAIRMAVDEVNEAGGIRSLGGARVVLLDGNSEGTPEKGASEAERLIREGCVALLGAYQSAVAYITTQVAERRRVPYVITVAVADDILERGFRYTFRVQPNARTIARDAVTYLKQLSERSPVQTVAFMYDQSLFGTSIADHLERFCTETGFQVVGRIPYNVAAADLSTEVNRLKAMAPDVAMFTGYFRDGVLVARTLRELQVELKAIFGVANGAFSHPDFVNQAGPASVGVMDANYYFDPRNPATQVAFEKYRERFGRSFSTHAIYAYEAARVVLDAIERAGAADPEAVRNALATTNRSEHILPQGPIQFDERGENINARAVLLQVIDGAPRVVLPEQYAEAEPIFPITGRA